MTLICPQCRGYVSDLNGKPSDPYWAEVARRTRVYLPEKLYVDFGKWVGKKQDRIVRYERGPDEERKSLVLQYYREFADRVLEGVRIAS
jgi:hypothetical protein